MAGFDPISAVSGAVESITGVVSEFVEDKDKANEINFRILQLGHKLEMALLQTKTVPWVDALVKLLFAAKMFVRPVGGAIMTGFGMYCHIKGIDIDMALHAIFDGALPGWGLSRHIEKQKAKKAMRALADEPEWN